MQLRMDTGTADISGSLPALRCLAPRAPSAHRAAGRSALQGGTPASSCSAQYLREAPGAPHGVDDLQAMLDDQIFLGSLARLCIATQRLRSSLPSLDYPSMPFAWTPGQQWLPQLVNGALEGAAMILGMLHVSFSVALNAYQALQALCFLCRWLCSVEIFVDSNFQQLMHGFSYQSYLHLEQARGVSRTYLNIMSLPVPLADPGCTHPRHSWMIA